MMRRRSIAIPARARGRDPVAIDDLARRERAGRCSDHVDAAGAAEPRRALDPLDRVLLEQELDALGDAGDDRVLARVNARHVDRRRRRETGSMTPHSPACSTTFSAWACSSRALVGMQPQLRHVPPSAGVTFDHGHAETELRRTNGRDVAAGAGADDDDIESVRHVGHIRKRTRRASAAGASRRRRERRRRPPRPRARERAAEAARRRLTLLAGQNSVLELLRDPGLDDGLGGDLDCLACCRIAAVARLSLLNDELAEPRQHELAGSLQLLLGQPVQFVEEIADDVLFRSNFSAKCAKSSILPMRRASAMPSSPWLGRACRVLLCRLPPRARNRFGRQS